MQFNSVGKEFDKVDSSGQACSVAKKGTSQHQKKIESIQLNPEEVSESYEYCRAVSKRHAKTFYFATQFLPKSKRKSVYAVYALCRYVDDIVDRAEDKLSRQTLTKEKIVFLIDKWKTDLEACYRGELINNPIMIAWLDTLKKYQIPMELPFELIEGVCMDLKFKSFETFDELYIYCYKVASVVGLMTSEIFGYKNKEALDYAIKLGIAMQLTNILRDVGEDSQRGRIYLPLEDLARFNYSPEKLKQGTLDENFIKLMQFEIGRARDFYAEADKGIPMLDKDSRMAVLVSRVNYSKILTYIEKTSTTFFANARSFLSP
ncbi:Squalene/phytoene synthase [Chloroherpeton thalassium ATCC 35110]|uniref:Squalene/phytoene synthase n=1 Tax=Chloroherpeton thalassium (strain ATCC 35110 / GB-78) TaxID=517418 RepID=B3QTG5_CHLT3|nr:Squalene/phytoene synthase [Chloroherpeton thalassium ATCC 35110]